ncbi:T9SS type A sorting domain-containing protein [Dyadobacter fanqingshengii]|uniref:T9SS type A sorting domain-containing protein n=1 Tax=Dyadobacter fanqingshengii TaxID=2906443 RepID=A0A9X1T975_9BACT|nr:T9SS type A sorting domain-containing protein [Dyadobacter fanqingshengii]MCF0039634.1 T9SS type A sorting domain-containing protein [Dyadobacter fanqingshengii]USJ38599.1 T9SS type A sorting domain-containing protein [Dyadobacter fanqingshengii]
MNKFQMILLVMAAFLMSHGIFASTYYVSDSGGNDQHSSANAKSSTTPWKSLKFINEAGFLVKGDSVLFKKGDRWMGASLKTTANGVYFGSYGMGRLPEIVSLASPALDIQPGADKEIIVSGLSFSRRDNKGIVAQLGQAWDDSHKGMQFGIIENNVFSGTVVVQGANNVFRKNMVDGSANDGNGNGIWEHHRFCHNNRYQENTVSNFSVRGIWTMIDTHDSIFEGNDVSNCQYAGIDLDGAHYIVYNHTVRNNTIHNIKNDAIELENAFNAVVTGNYLYDGGRSYIYIINYPQCKILNGVGAKVGTGAILNTRITRNVMIGGGKDNSSVAIGVHKAGGILIANNSIYNFRSRFIDLDYKVKSEVTKIRLVNNAFSTIAEPSWYGMINFTTDDINVLEQDDYNCFYNEGRQDIYSNRKTHKLYGLREYQTLSGQAKHSISQNPGFDPARKLQLNANSPCINSGLNLGDSFIGIRTDIGASEFGIKTSSRSLGQTTNPSATEDENLLNSENEHASFIYPNPAFTYLRLSNTAKRGIASIQIFDSNGTLYQKATYARNNYIDITQIPPGHYLVELRYENGAVTSKRFEKL